MDGRIITYIRLGRIIDRDTKIVRALSFLKRMYCGAGGVNMTRKIPQIRSHDVRVGLDEVAVQAS